MCENKIIVNKIIFYLAINVAGNSDIFLFYFVVYRNGNVSMHHIPSCIMSSCIMLYHQHKPYIHMYRVRKGGENFKMITWIKKFINKHLNIWLLYYNY